MTIDEMDVRKALETYRDIKLELQPTLDSLKQLERKIKAHVLETGEAIQIDGAKTEIRKGYTRSSWDNKALRGYAAAHPEILEFVKEAEVKPTVSIKLS